MESQDWEDFVFSRQPKYGEKLAEQRREKRKYKALPLTPKTPMSINKSKLNDQKNVQLSWSALQKNNVLSNRTEDVSVFHVMHDQENTFHHLLMQNSPIQPRAHDRSPLREYQQKQKFQHSYFTPERGQHHYTRLSPFDIYQDHKASNEEESLESLAQQSNALPYDEDDGLLSGEADEEQPSSPEQEQMIVKPIKRKQTTKKSAKKARRK